jgi:penicillin V acylase-like amidase (Ntn superfamily)
MVLLFTFSAHPCSTIGALNNKLPYVGKNYDWMQTLGRVYVNKHKVRKNSLVLRAGDGPASWVSQFGSVTFNQFGREFPNGGMNEAGLMIEIMWLTSSVYPSPDARPTVNELQWIQYMLDNHSRVADIVASARTLRVSMVTAPVHYLACDQTGACGTFEYIGGQMVSHSQAQLPYASLTNDTYENSLAFLRQHVGFGGSLPIPSDTSSLSRFVRGTALAQSVTDGNIKEQMFTVLDQVSQANTVWQISYNLNDRVVHFRTNLNREVKSVDLGKLNFSCKTPVLSSDIQIPRGGLINEDFTEYSFAENLKWVDEAIHGLPMNLPENVKQQMIGAVSQYPNSTLCTE